MAEELAVKRKKIYSTRGLFLREKERILYDNILINPSTLPAYTGLSVPSFKKVVKLVRICISYACHINVVVCNMTLLKELWLLPSECFLCLLLSLLINETSYCGL